MKHLNHIYEFVESYPWKLISNNDEKVEYAFNDPSGNRYLLQFKNIQINKGVLGKTYEMVYFVYDDDIKNYSVSKIVNVNPYRTLQTIFGEILPDFLKNRWWVNKLFFEGLSKDLQKEYISQRTRLYLRYLKRNPMRGFRLYHNGNKIELIKE